MASASTIATETRGPSFCAASSATASSPSCTALADRQLVAGLAPARCAAPRRRRARRAPAGRGAYPETSSSAARAASRSPSSPALTMRPARGRARPARPARVAVGPALLRQLRQGDQKGGLRDASAASAPCRNRRARRRARPPDCRHRARASGSARGSRACDSRRSIWMARKIWRSFGRGCGSSRGSISRASCIDSVEPPETMRPLPANWPAARGKRQHVDAVMVPEALVLIGDQHLDELRVDLVEAGGEPPAAVGRGEGAQQRAVAVDDLGRDRELFAAAAAERRGRALRRQPSRGRRARANEPRCIAASAAALAQSCLFRHPRRIVRLLLASGEIEDCPHGALTSIMPGRGAGRVLRPVHVLDAGRRMGVDARRHRAHHIGERDVAVAAGFAVEGRDEAVVAELEMRRLGPRQPGEIRQVGARRRGADCRSRSRPASRSLTSTREAQSLCSRDLQHDHEALVLRRPR